MDPVKGRAQSSVTRPPMASALMLALSAAPAAPTSALLPPAILAAYLAVWITRAAFPRATFFPYQRDD